jgi:tRNA (guanosine-2'-O-)-methyltransferase
MKTIDDRKIRNEVAKHLTSFLTDERNARLLDVIENRTRHLTIVIEDLYQTQNISAVMRTCECLGIQDVHIVEGENEFSIHKAISMGADKWLTKYHYPANDSNIIDCISQLKQKGYSVIATLPGDDSCFLHQLELDQPMAFLFGTELNGLSEEAIKHADKTVKIPMYGFTTSFNISNSVAIIATYLIEKLRNSSVNWKLSEEEKEIIYLEWLQKSIKTPDLIIEKFLTENN